MKKLMCMALSIVCLAGCMNSNGPKERWTTFDGKTIALPEMGDKQATVYFFREKDSFSGNAVNVFVDRDYLASILNGGYRAAVICSSGDKLLASFSRNDIFADRDSGIDYNFYPGSTSYVRVQLNDKGEPVFHRVSKEYGEKIIKELKQETQTLPRVKNNRLCKAGMLEKITLSAHSLFKFDKYDYKNMLPKGKEEILEVARKIKANKIKIKEISVVGYTDPMGTEQYNEKLSQRRANTVKQALINAGIETKISAKGLGEQNLIVKDCLKKYPNQTTKRKSCDQINRRVEIIFYANDLTKK